MMKANLTFSIINTMLQKFLVIFLFSLFFLNLPVHAKVLPRFSGGSRTSGGPVASGFYVSPKLRADRQALNIYFGNLSRVKSVSYVLTYTGNGSDQGIMGSIDASNGNTTSRELLFGTCSTSVCTYHSNISNMKLEVTVEQLSGKRTLKRYRIKV